MNKEIETAINLLEETNRYVPKASILDELEMVIERLRFSGLNFDLSHRMKAENIKDKLSLIFKEEISNQMLEFLYRLLDQNNLEIVTGDSAQLLIDETQRYYARVEEISVTVAIELTDDFKNWLEGQMLKKFAVRARIVFIIDNSVIAGSIISFRNFRHDLSYRKNFLTLVQNHLSEDITKIKS